MEQTLYHYKARVLRVVDADTLSVSLDVGFYFSFAAEVRLLRINAYETRLGKNTTADQKARGLAGKAYVMGLLLDKDIIVKTVLDKEKFGRVLGEVYFKDGDAWVNLNDDLVARGYAILQAY
jgi:micrococcal nuclease